MSVKSCDKFNKLLIDSLGIRKDTQEVIRLNGIRTVILVEGFSSQPGTERLELLARRILSLPDMEVIIPNYFERYGMLWQFFREKTIPQYAAVVYDKIYHLTDPLHGFGKPILIGYSMGGLVSRYLVERMGLSVKATILVGTSIRGIKFSKLPLWQRLMLKIRTPPCVKDMEEGSEFLKELNKNPPGDNYYYIVSGCDNLVPLSSILPGVAEEKKKVVPTDHSGLIPKSDKDKIDVSISAIPEIIKILQKEFAQS